MSPDTGIEVDGHEYKLTPQDIELDQERFLGSGSGGVVQLGVHRPTGMQVAIKTVKVDNKAKREQIMNEIKGLISAEGCPNLVQWYAGFMSKSTCTVHVALEYMDGGSLADLKRRLQGKGVPPEALSCLAKQVIEGLHYLHSRKLLHRDVKPENILHNTAGEVKLTDFGISKDLNSTVAMAATFVGTATYMSPERASGQDYSFAADIWSIGLVLYELATGEYPFPAITSFPVLYDFLCTKPEPRLDAEVYPEDLCSFVALGLNRDQSKRPDTEALLGHPFLAQCDKPQEVFRLWVEKVPPDPRPPEVH